MVEGMGLLVLAEGRKRQMTFQDFDQWLIEQARAMPRAMNKGGSQEAQANVAKGDVYSQNLMNQGQAEQNQILPFLQSEMTNPQGFGTQGVNELETAGGEATSGALGQAKEAANLRASRMGNPSSTASIIDAASRAAGQQQSTNALDINKANLQEKLNQQQAGEQGIASLSAGNIGESLSSLGLSNQAVNSYIQAMQNTNPLNEFGTFIGDIGKGVGAAASGILGHG